MYSSNSIMGEGGDWGSNPRYLFCVCGREGGTKIAMTTMAAACITVIGSVAAGVPQALHSCPKCRASGLQSIKVGLRSPC